MATLLTTKQVQEYLKIDRTTVYRMLKDGRLKGVKVGQQWRFPQEDVEAFLQGNRPSGGRVPIPTLEGSVSDILPMHCVQPIQDVFAEMAKVGSVSTDPSGEPISNISNACKFCNLILQTPEGRQACEKSWRKLARQTSVRPKFTRCHAGLQYARAPIYVNDELVASLIAGQFYSDEPDPVASEKRVKQLADTFNINEQELLDASRELLVLDSYFRNQIGKWLERVANTFEDIGRERADLLNRLRQIADISLISASSTQ